MGHRLHTFTTLIFAALLAPLATADLAVPGWYREAGAPDWHYRLPITIAGSAAPGSTIQLDVDFAQALTALGVDAGAVAFDAGSVRVVRPGGGLAVQQEFTDRIYNGALDGAGNARGEVRFILQDAAPGHYLYFDIVANGAKPGAPGVSVINGHFEQSTGSTPSGWVRAAINSGGAQNNEVYRTGLGSSINLGAACGTGGANNLDTSPNSAGGVATGEAWHLLGYRDNCEDGESNGGGSERIRLSRDIAVPAGAAAGVLEFYFQVQSFDGISNNNNYDWVTVVINGSTVNHNSLGINNTTAPVLRIDNNRLGRNGYGGSVNDFGWKRARLDLSPWAGSTVNFRVETRHSAADDSHRSWVKIDDVVWSLQTAALLAPEGFGANVILPADTATGPASEYAIGDTLFLQAVVDATAIAVRADLFDEGGSPIVTGIALFDDGTHGDATPGDGIWSNDGSVPADPTYTFLLTDPPGGNWLLRALAFDASVALNGANDGLVRRAGQPDAPQIQANFHNIDEQTLVLGGALLEIDKSVQTLSDPGGGSEPKSLPGAFVQYDVRVANLGPSATDAGSVVLVDNIPAELAICVDPVCTCSTPCTPGDPVTFDDSGSLVATGLVFTYASDVSYSLDGSDYSYLPQPDAAGFDPAIRFLRVNPAGALAAPVGGDNAEFHLRYVLRLQ